MQKSKILEFEVDKEFEGKRLDQFLASVYPEYSRSYYQKLIKEEHVLDKEKNLKKPSFKVKSGQKITLIIPPPKPLEVIPENIPLKVFYEDEDLAVIYKPPHMVVHPSPGHTSGTLVNALLYHLKNISQFQGKERTGIVHRLDKETAGLMVVAKSEFAHKELQELFREGKVNKKYKAIVVGLVKKEHGFIDFLIGRSIYNRQKMGTVSINARDALTEYWVEKRWEKHNLTLVDIKLHTGRTHQIRVHFSELRHPLLNDKVYGFKKSQLKSEVAKELSDKLDYHALVAYRLAFNHPRTGEKIDISLENLPEPLEKIIKILNKEK